MLYQLSYFRVWYVMVKIRWTKRCKYYFVRTECKDKQTFGISNDDMEILVIFVGMDMPLRRIYGKSKLTDTKNELWL